MISRALFLLLLLALLLTLAPAVRAQVPAPVSLQAQVGYDGAGTHRAGYWFPALVTVSNDGPDRQVSIEWRVAGSNAPLFSYELDLPRGARKQIPLALVENNFSRTAIMRVRADGITLAEQRLILDGLGEENVMVGVLSSEPTLLSGLDSVTIVPNLGTRAVHLDPALLPDEAALLAGLHVIMIHDLDTSSLSQAQRAALEQWVRRGGELIVGGGAQADRTTPGLADLLPVEVGALRPGVSTDGLGALAARPDLAQVLPTTTASAVTLKPGAQYLDRNGLLVAGQLDAGRVVFATFDLAATRAWAGEATLWARVFQIQPRMELAASFRLRGENLLRISLNPTGLRLPSTGLLLVMMAMYILVIGPLNFLVLRRLRRPELAWISTPLLVVAFLATTYLISLGVRGTGAQLSQLTIVQSQEGQGSGQSTAFLGLFSPQRRSYRLDLAPEALLTPGSFESFRMNQVTVTSDGTSTGMRDLLVDVASFRTLMAEQHINVPGVRSDLRLDGQTIQGEVQVADVTLRDVQIVRRSSSQYLGDLRPGLASSVSLPINRDNFPEWGQLNQGGLLQRDNVMNTLFSYDRFTVGGPTFMGTRGLPDDGVYLLGWVESPVITLTLDGNPANQQGETLYIIRLNL